MKKVLPVSSALIPETAENVFAGQLFSIHQWPQVMFDGTTKTFEMLKRSDTAQIIVLRGSQILLVKDEQPGRSPRLHFPGGRVDPEDESWESAAKRELREETGLTCRNWKLIEVQQPIVKIEWFTPTYLATEIVKQEAQQLDVGGEKIELIWSEFEDVRKRLLSGAEQTMQYLVPLFLRITSVEALSAMSTFTGTEIER